MFEPHFFKQLVGVRVRTTRRKFPLFWGESKVNYNIGNIASGILPGFGHKSEKCFDFSKTYLL